MNQNENQLFEAYDLEIYSAKKKSNKYIIVCHGFGDVKIGYNKYRLLFNEIIDCYNIVAFTFSHCKDEIYKVTNIIEWVDDLEKVVGWVKSQTRSAEISLMGISMGAWVCTLYCIRDTSIESNICIGPVFSLHTGIKKNGGVAVLLLKEGKKKLNDIEVSSEFLKSLIINQPINVFLSGKYRIPTLLLVGSLDNIYRKTDTIIAEDLLDKQKVSCLRKEIMEGCHFINNGQAINLLCEVIKRYLR